MQERTSGGCGEVTPSCMHVSIPISDLKSFQLNRKTTQTTALFHQKHTPIQLKTSHPPRKPI